MAAVVLPPELQRRFDALVFDWDGTAVADRHADATELRRLIEALCAAGTDVAVISGTNLANIDGQLAARPSGPGRLHLLLNRGSEVFRVGPTGPELVYRRTATAAEDETLTAAARLAVERLASRQGFDAKVVADRLNRRKIDIIPEPAWAAPGKAQMAQLLAAVQERLLRFGYVLPQVVATATSAAREAGLSDPRVTSDAKYVEIGLTDKSDAARWILADLWRRGIGPGLVLVIGDEMGPLGGLPGSDSLMLVSEASRATAVSVGVEPGGVPPGVLLLGGGPATFVEILRDQLDRRRRGELPDIDMAPGWVLVVDGYDPMLERVRETQVTIGDGRFGTRGSALVAAGRPAVLAAGLYEGEGFEEHLAHCPRWNRVESREESDVRGLVRVLDLHTGALREQLAAAGREVTTFSIASFPRVGICALRAAGPSADVDSGAPLRAPDGEEGRVRADLEGTWMTVETAQDGSVAAAAAQDISPLSSAARIERFAAYAVSVSRPAHVAAGLDRLGQARASGFERLLVDHRMTWGSRWEDADVVIDGDADMQRDVRFALFHLMATVADTGEAAVGARGLSGPAYRGHVFWDADVYVLPYLAATHPESARAMLEYRVRRLEPARARARAEGRAGARFPWESAREGTEVAPARARDMSGRVIPVRTGELEEHIVADVAWAAACYLDWTGDEAFAADGGTTLLVETARYWASRIRVDAAGRGHIERVIGPDEYHEEVADDAYTNGMARWNLRRAAALRAVTGTDESARWLELAQTLVDGYDAGTNLYEQFAGFFRLEPLVIADVATRPVAADVLLGRERVQAAQVVKQPDVLMLHHLVPGEVAPGSLLPNLLYYEPRTAHGSSLSPGIHASLFARARRLQDALHWLRVTTRIDLDDLSESTAGGLHLAAMGSVWQALAMGFAGVRPRGDALEIDPVLPACWRSLEIRVRFRGSRMAIRIEPEHTIIQADPPARVISPGAALPVTVDRSIRLPIPAQQGGAAP